MVTRGALARERFVDYVRDTYRVLLTRGLRGCYVHFQDQQTQDFVLSRLERPRTTLARAAEEPPSV